MSQPLLSVIIPTIGRPTLARTLASVVEQPAAGLVETFVVVDSHAVDVHPRAPVRRLAFSTVASYDAGFSAWGHPQRNYAMQYARGEWLAFLDDDDAWTPDALQAILEAVTLDPAPLHIFRMQYDGSGVVLWRDTALEHGNVGTPMMVVKNDPAAYGEWGGRYEGDLDFLNSTLVKVGPDAVRWHRDIIASIRPVDVQ